MGRPSPNLDTTLHPQLGFQNEINMRKNEYSLNGLELSVNSSNQSNNHWSVKWDQFEDPVLPCDLVIVWLDIGLSHKRLQVRLFNTWLFVTCHPFKENSTEHHSAIQIIKNIAYCRNNFNVTYCADELMWITFNLYCAKTFLLSTKPQ